MPCSASLLRGGYAYTHLRTTSLRCLHHLQNPKTLQTSLTTTTSGGGGMAAKGGILLGWVAFRLPQRRPRPRSVVVAAASSGGVSTRSVDLDRRRSQGTGLSLGRRNGPFPYFLQQNYPYGRYAFDDYSEDESDREAVAPSQQKV